jgi:transposase
MFVRVKTTPKSPRKSVQIVSSYRIEGKVRQKIVKHIGIAKDDNELIELKALAESIKTKLELDGQLPFYNAQDIENMSQEAKNKSLKEQKEANNKKIFKQQNIAQNMSDYTVNLLDLEEQSRTVKGIHDIYGKLYNELGFNKIIANPARHKNAISIIKEIVLARVANPDSKRASVLNLEQHFGVNLNLTAVYRMMDKLDDKAIDKLNTIVYNQTKSLFKDKIDVVFFDATTIYFESFSEDEFKKNGYSKDLKFNQPQVLLALMVTKEGLPIGYKAFSGDTYEGHTLIPVLEEIKEKYDLDKVVYVADSGMFNKANLINLDKNNFDYIVGARIKNLANNIKDKILDKSNYKSIESANKNIRLDTKVARFALEGRTLLVSYNESRAKKDKADREQGIAKLRSKLSKHKSIKGYLSNHGYKKYLQLSECKGKITVNEEKIKQDSKWDGLKGFIISANSQLVDDEILTQYNNLWQVEQSFRISKHDLKIRPIYHYKPSRVKAHLAISFIAYTLIRHLEYRVRLQYKKLSPEKIRQLLIAVQVSLLFDTKTKKKYILPSNISIDAKKIYQLMDVGFKTKVYML